MRRIKDKLTRWQAPPIVWSFTTYFTEGFPYIIIRNVAPFFFRTKGVSLETIGLTSLFSVPWIIKFLWGPHVDEYSTKRKWLLGSQAALALLIIITAFTAPLDHSVQIIAFLFFAGSFIAATHDIAIDGYYMEGLDKDGQARFIGYRVMAYRIAMMTGTGIIATIGTTINWFTAFLSAGIIMTLFFLFHVFFLPVNQESRKPLRELLPTLLKVNFMLTGLALALLVFGLRKFVSSDSYHKWQNLYPVLTKLSFAAWVGILLFAAMLVLALFRKKIRNWIMKDPDSFYSRAFLSFMDRDKMGVVLAFIILIRTGEFTLGAMAGPFMVDLGIQVHYGWISGGVGLPCSIAGAMLGGWLIGRFTLKKMIWPFILAQNITNVIYMFLALGLSDKLAINTGNPAPVAIGIFNLITVAIIHGFDQFAGCLGTAVLMTYLMRICLSDYKAAHYAIGTGLMSVSGLFAGILSGFLASWLGYGFFFGISFLMSIPGMALILAIPMFDGPDKAIT